MKIGHFDEARAAEERLVARVASSALRALAP